MARLAVGTALLTMCHALSSIAKSFSGVRRPREMIVWLEAPEVPEEPDNPDNLDEPDEPDGPDDTLLISE